MNIYAFHSFVTTLAVTHVKKVTWDGVVQKEPKETSYKHAGGQQDHRHLVKLHHTYTL